MFKITSSKGFHVVLGNGWTISVQFGGGNYSENYDAAIGTGDIEAGKKGSKTAEIAAWDKDKNWHQFDEGDTVKGHVTSNELLEFMNMIAGK